MQQAQDLQKRIEETEKILSLFWGGLKLCLRGFVYIAAGISVIPLLKIAASQGLTRFDSKSARDNGEEELARMMEEINKDYKRNQILFDFQARISGATRMVETEKGRGVGVSPRPNSQPQKDQGPEI